MSADRWCWFARLDEVPADALAAARARTFDGEDIGVLVAWAPGERPVPFAARVDRRVVDPDGPAMAVSWADAGSRHVLYDDPAVVAATQRVLAGPWPPFVSTLAADSSHLAGTLTGAAPGVVTDWPGWWETDPFARILEPEAAARRVPASSRRPSPVPQGPVHQRYGGAAVARAMGSER